MIIIVVIDKLLAFTGPFPITLSEKLFASGAPRLLSADPEAASCSWRGVWVISEKTFFSLFFCFVYFIIDFAFNEQGLQKSPSPLTTHPETVTRELQVHLCVGKR